MSAVMLFTVPVCAQELGTSPEAETQETAQDVSTQTKELSECEIALSETTFTYDGTAKTPSVTVKDGDKELEAEKDYTVTYENNTNAGTAQVTVAGTGSYTGTATQSFTIEKAAQQFSYTKTYAKAYGSKAFTLEAKLKAGDGQLTYSSSNAKVAAVNGNGKVTIKGTGTATITVKAAASDNYKAASAKVTVKVSPAKQTVTSLKSSKAWQLTVKWKKDTRATGYQVQYTTDKSFKKSVKTTTVTKNSISSKTFSNLTAGKKYYVRVRSYKTAKVNGKSTKLCGAWSTAKRSGSIKKGTPQMKAANVSWDLKNNKTLTYKTKYAGIGMKKQKVKISGYKVKNSKKAGYKELTFTVKFTNQWNVSDSEVHKIVENMEKGSIGGLYYYTITDYNTGKCLEKKNNLNVTVEKTKDWNFSSKTYYDKHDCWISIDNASVTVKVTYPSDYKGLCIGVGGHSTVNETANDGKFWNGTVSFAKTSMRSKNDKSVAHFMRVK